MHPPVLPYVMGNIDGNLGLNEKSYCTKGDNIINTLDRTIYDTKK